MAWYDLDHSPASFRRSKEMKAMAAKLVSPEGGSTSHSRRGASLPIMLDAIHQAGKAFRLSAISIDGRIAGYYLSTKAEDNR